MDKSQHPWPKLVPPRQDRRRERRLEPPPELRCAIVGSKAKLRVRDVSLSGVAVWANMPLPVDGEYEVTLEFGPLNLSRRAHIVHCKWETDDRWLVGLKFVARAGRNSTVKELIDLIGLKSSAQ